VGAAALTRTGEKNHTAIVECNKMALGLLTYGNISTKGKAKWDNKISQGNEWAVLLEFKMVHKQELRAIGMWHL
jgi:hypothetical protein